jgi:hypothetical protein
MRKYMSIPAVLPAVLLLLMLVACAPAPKATDPVSVTKVLFDDINKGRAEAATNCFAADGELVTAFGQPRGAEKLRTFFKMGLIPMKTKVEIKELEADGENVKGIFEIRNADLGNNSEETLGNTAPISMKLAGVVQEGKIKSMTWGTNK